MYLAHSKYTIIDHFITIHITFESAHWHTLQRMSNCTWLKEVFLTFLCHGPLWYFPEAHGNLLRIMSKTCL